MRCRRLLAASVMLALLSACDSSPSAAPSPGPSVTAAAPSTDRVANHFSPSRPYPGPTWTRDGRPVGDELNTIAGPRHCEWQSATMMHLGWPLGTVSKTSADIRQFIRDPEGAIDERFRDKLGIAVGLPPDARDTGYRNGPVELWLSPSEPDAAYLRIGNDVERWPRAGQVVACM